MSFRTSLLCALAIALAAGLGFAAISSGTAQNAGTPESRAEIEAIIYEYLMDNPGVVIEAIDKYNELEAIRAEAEAMAGLDTHLPVLVAGNDGYAAGAGLSDANVVVIELFDYHCGFCKQAQGYVADLLDQQDDVRVVFYELPILREESDYAAKAALAARDQGKYAEMHFAMMAASGILTENRIERIAADNSVDVSEMQGTIASADYDDVLMRIREIAIDIGVSGTPAFIIATPDGSYSRLIGGWQPEQVSQAIEEARRSAS